MAFAERDHLYNRLAAKNAEATELTSRAASLAADQEKLKMEIAACKSRMALSEADIEIARQEIGALDLIFFTPQGFRDVR